MSLLTVSCMAPTFYTQTVLFYHVIQTWKGTCLGSHRNSTDEGSGPVKLRRSLLVSGGEVLPSDGTESDSDYQHTCICHPGTSEWGRKPLSKNSGIDCTPTKENSCVQLICDDYPWSVSVESLRHRVPTPQKQ